MTEEDVVAMDRGWQDVSGAGDEIRLLSIQELIEGIFRQQCGGRSRDERVEDREGFCGRVETSRDGQVRAATENRDIGWEQMIYLIP